MGTTAEKLTYLNTTKGKIKDSINLTGAGITTEPFRQYAVKIKDAYVDIINNGTDTLYNNFPKVSGSGTDLSLQNTYEAPMQIDLKGNTKQQILPDGYTQVDYIVGSGTQYIKTGYKPNANTNVVSKCYVSDFSLSRNYICGTISGSPAKDRYQICFGTITTSANTMWCRDESVHRFNITPPTKPFDITTSGENITIDGTTYTYTDTQAFDSNAKELYLLAINNNGSASDIGNGVRLYSFKIYESSSLLHNYIPCYRNSDNAVGLYDLITNTFLTNAGTGSFTYGSVAPTPDVPMPVQVVSGNNTITICGKNLFDKDNANVLNAYINTSGVIKANANNSAIYIPCKPNTTYTISRIKPSSGNSKFAIGTTSEIPVAEAQCIDFIRNDTANDITITTSSNAKYLIIWLWVTDYTMSWQDTIDSLQIEYGNTATTYEAYQSQTYPINLPSGMELCKIGTYQDYIYKENDKWYLHKEIGKVDFANITWDSASHQAPNYRRYYTNTIPNVKYVSSNTQLGVGLAEKYSIHKGQGMGSYGSENCFAIDVSIVQAVDTQTPTGLFYYALATPTNTEITDTTLISQLEAIYNAKSKNGTTNINQVNNDLGFIITASALEKEV